MRPVGTAHENNQFDLLVSNEGRYNSVTGDQVLH